DYHEQTHHYFIHKQYVHMPSIGLPEFSKELLINYNTFLSLPRENESHHRQSNTIDLKHNSINTCSSHCHGLNSLEIDSLHSRQGSDKHSSTDPSDTTVHSNPVSCATSKGSFEPEIFLA
ncbi:17035_t:CDS:2, partial [Dentiscutata heterogama]